MVSASASSVRTARVFFLNDTATTEIYTLSLHDALPISHPRLAVLNARILVGPEERLDPLCAAMSASPLGTPPDLPGPADRKSTRLNSSHANISYAVFCLKKKTLEIIGGDAYSTGGVLAV